MLDASPEESVTSPVVVGILKLALIVSVGTGMGWEFGHRRVPSRRTLRAMCDLWSALSSSCRPFESLATQSGKMMRKPSTPLAHCVGGVVPPPPSSAIPHLHVMRVALITFRFLAKDLTFVWSLPPAR